MGFIKECLAELRLRFRMEAAIAEKLEDLEKRVYSLEQTLKLKEASIKNHEQQIQQLRLMLSKK